MLMHAWELGNAYFDYFFFKENCSYHILSLLEVADPRLHLTDQFVAWTVPADTVRVVTQYRDLVADIAYRPSRSTQIRRKRAMLSKGEDQSVLRLIGRPSSWTWQRTICGTGARPLLPVSPRPTGTSSAPCSSPAAGSRSLQRTLPSCRLPTGQSWATVRRGPGSGQDGGRMSFSKSSRSGPATTTCWTPMSASRPGRRSNCSHSACGITTGATRARWDGSNWRTSYP